MPEVRVTGIGVVSPFGVGLEAFREGLAGLRLPLIEEIGALVGTIFQGQRGGAIPGLAEAAQTLPTKLRKFMSRSALLGCLAGREAFVSSGLEGRVEGSRIGIFAASGLTAANFDAASDMLFSCVGEDGEFSDVLLGAEGLARMNPLDSFKILPNMPPCILSTLLGIRGPNLIFNPWESHGAAALLEGFRAVAEGEVDAALVGAADAPEAPSTCVHLLSQGRITGDAFPSPASAYLVLERCEGNSEPRIMLQEALSMASEDSLFARMGQCFAASPALRLAGACLDSGPSTLQFSGLYQAFRVEP